MIKYGNYLIDDSASGEQIKTTCPVCATLGKSNIKDKCLSINKAKSLLNCHKCGFTGFYGETSNPKVEFKRPDLQNLTILTDKHLTKFTRRGISQQTIIRNDIKSAKNDYWAFPYYEGRDVINVKYKRINKETGKKELRQAAGAKQLVYKFNDIIDQKEIIICEGEEDALSFEEAGILFACSVSQGAPNAKDKNIEKKLACIYNCFDVFEQAEFIYLAGDNDENGQRMNREMIKMFTAEKCKLINYDDCKDANEYLLKHGKEKLKALYTHAKDVPIEGVFKAEDFKAEMLYNYKNAQPVGSTTYFPKLDERWTHRAGEVNIWTGYNNEGKSLFLRQLLLIKSIHDDWKHALFCPEDMPLAEFFTDIIESYIGMSADIKQKYWNNYMNEMQFMDGFEFVNKHFFVVFPEEDHSIDTLLSKFSYCIRKNNVKDIVLDPYNQIHHLIKTGEREDLYIGRFMSKLKQFALKHDVGIHLVAHQATPTFNANENYPKPNLYKIKGGGTFSDKADNVVIIWREHRNTDQANKEVKFISQKIKKQKLTGKPGEVIFNYELQQNRYTFNGVSPINEKIEKQAELYPLEVNPDDWLEPSNSDEEAPF